MNYKKVIFEVAHANGNGYYDYKNMGSRNRLKEFNYEDYINNPNAYTFYIEEEPTLKEQVQEIIKTGYFINSDLGHKYIFIGARNEYIRCKNSTGNDLYIYKDMVIKCKSITFEQFIDLDYTGESKEN